MQSLNPAMSVIVDTFYHSDDSKEGIRHIFEEISGFGHTDGDGHEHEDGALEDGFNLRHLELYLSADVDPYFRGWAIGAISEESAELEEAVIQSTSLPAGLQLQGGKFLSNVSRMNAQHPHQWDFVDAPLVHQLLLGDHGLNEKGLQLSWLAPTPFQLRLGIEALQGGNEQVAQYHGEDAFDRKAGPRLWIGWAKVAPNLPERHGLEVGLAVGRGVHQEEHDEFDNADTVPPLTEGADGDTDHWFDGHSTFVGADIVYKYDAPKEHGAGDVTLQSGYLWRRRDLELVDHFFAGAPVGESRVDTQDGYYAQATYGFLPRWRTGLRWEQIGMVNHSDLPDGTDESFGESRRLSAILDFLPSESSRLRLQVARGDYDTAEGDEEVWQVFVQWMISLGRHGSAGHRCGHTDHHAHECSGHAHE